MAAPIYNGLPDTETMALLGNLETGKVVKIFFSKKRPEKRTLEIKPLTSQLVWIKAQGVRPEGSVCFRDIKEIRRGKSSKDFDKWQDDTRRVDQRLCFVVYYGHDFKLHSLSVVAGSPEERDKWVRGIDFMMEDATNVSYVNVVDRWLAREFNAMTERMRSGGAERMERLALKSLKSWMARVNYKISTNRLRENFQNVDADRIGELTLDEFKLLFHRLVHVQGITDEWFTPYMAKLHKERIVTVEKFQRFLVDEQKDFSDNRLSATEITTDVKDIMKQFLADPGREIQSRLFFSVEEFLDYLYSKHNTIWNSRYDMVHQDMTKPLSWYWIASSHNTYLTGDQMASESSVEAYAHCLRMGCKCLELDCWDGPDGHPLVFHGHTLTSKIRFLEVIQCIKEYAWVASDYPLILSIENHCSLGQQRNMASAFKDIFGDMLLTDLLQRESLVLPSPDQLKRKILLKHKKLPTDPSKADPIDYTLDDNARDGDLSNSVKNGMLYLDDPIDQTWSPHFFVLTSTKLYYSEETTHDDDEEEDDTVSTTEGQTHDELHFGEKWFHGRLPGGRNDGARLLEKYADLGDGTFLVRESETFVGDFSLSFRWQGSVNHCRIKSKQELGQVKYYLIDHNMFDSLYSLIMYYRSHPLKSSNFTMTLKEPVPQPQSHGDKEWYHERCDRDRAEEMLKRIPYDGAFLVRRSESDQMSYAISFRAESKIKHCRIRQEGRLFTIGTAEFESLVELVQYYEKYPLYKKMKLRKPVSELTVEQEGVEPELHQDSIYDSGIYHLPNTFTTSVSKYLCRAGMEAVQTTFELEVVSTEYQEDPNLAHGESGPAGGVRPANVQSILRGKLHLRMANIGHPVDPKTTKLALSGQTGMTTTTLYPTDQCTAYIALPGKSHFVVSQTASISAYGGGSLVMAQPETAHGMTVKKRVVRAHHMVENNREVAALLFSKRDELEPVTETNREADSERQRKMARMVAVRNLEGSPDKPHTLMAHKQLKTERTRDLKTLEIYRLQTKHDGIQSMLSESISTEHTIHPSFGTAEFFEFVLRNPFNVDHTVRIEWEDKSLHCITDTREWRYFKQLNQVMSQIEENMFNRENKSHHPEVFLRPKETINIPFKYLSFLADQSVQPQGPIDPFRQEMKTKKTMTDVLKTRSIKIFFKSEDEKPLAILILRVEPQPHVIDQTFRFHSPEQTFLKKSIRLPPLQDLPGSPVGGGGLIQTFVRCSDANIICDTKTTQPGEPQDVFIKVPLGASPQIKRFFMSVYLDPFLARPVQTWQFYVHALQRVDVASVEGQTSRFSLLLRGTQASRLVQCFSSHPQEMTLYPGEQFMLAAGAVHELNVAIRPVEEGSKYFYINVVDVEFHQLVRTWLVCVSARAPMISRAFELALPVGGGKGCSKKISYSNPYPHKKTFLIHSNRDDLLQFKENRLDIEGGGTATLGLRFVPVTKSGTAEVLVFINDEDDKNEETFRISAVYQRM